MTKARILANLISDNAELSDGQISVSEVVGAAPLASPTFTGTVTSTGDINLGDNDKAIFGSGSDLLQIYRNSSGSYVKESGSGSLYIQGTDVRIQNASGENILNGTSNGAVTLYYNDSPKIASSSTGATISGDVGATTASITGKTTTNELDLNAIASTISDTAVDVFVYDTSKDSDGGSWRKRTQHTSWYNEALNTATRGSRKEFPAVAVIVAESTQVTIYDGDDPDLPMWMVFNRGGTAHGSDNVIGSGGDSMSSVVMLNGRMMVGTNAARQINLISEVAYRHSTSGAKPYNGNITERNSGKGTGTAIASLAIVNNTINDIAMTVLPNAPIDAATGLPVPTIAVATEGGVSLIKDDGSVDSVSSVYGRPQVEQIGFKGADRLIGSCHSGNTDDGVVFIQPSDLSFPEGTDTRYPFFTSSDSALALKPLAVKGYTPTTALSQSVAVGGNSGFGLIHEDKDAPTKGMVSYTTLDYATGHMVGDIKLATLSDTDDTDVTGSELVTNGTFDSDTTGWTVAGSGASAAVSSGQLVLARVGSSSNITQYITTVVGQAYTLSFDFTAASGGANMYATLSGLSTITATATTGSYSITAVATSTSTYVQFQIWNTTNGTITLDNISVRLAEEDRSVNGNGLQVFGSITKDPVASGADLVAYSGFSASNYLEQPYNSDLNFGTGDFSFMVWLNTPDNSAAGTIIHRSSSTKAQSNFLSSGAVIQVEFNGTNLYGLVGTNGFSVNTGPDIPRANFPNNIWTHYALVRNGSTLSAYLNGKLFDTDTNTLTTTNTSATLFYGERPGSSRPFNGKMALTKWSATAPSPEQISKIYEDEKFLFQDGAKATLYGDSNYIKALSHDDTTDLLHVGTSAGRSVFQGLRRVDNTTDAVGAAISASNGLVAED